MVWNITAVFLQWFNDENHHVTHSTWSQSLFLCLNCKKAQALFLKKKGMIHYEEEKTPFHSFKNPVIRNKNMMQGLLTRGQLSLSAPANRGLWRHSAPGALRGSPALLLTVYRWGAWAPALPKQLRVIGTSEAALSRLAGGAPPGWSLPILPRRRHTHRYPWCKKVGSYFWTSQWLHQLAERVKDRCLDM